MLGPLARLMCKLAIACSALLDSREQLRGFAPVPSTHATMGLLRKDYRGANEEYCKTILNPPLCPRNKPSLVSMCAKEEGFFAGLDKFIGPEHRERALAAVDSLRKKIAQHRGTFRRIIDGQVAA